ncbi:dipicolinate synthase [Ralstonia pickettii]|uniref:Dipicolinate synthase n=1 Tax=Ralstonia pickettii TaxID=329 RepID=A0A2N4TKR5_RALPI|nr:AlpA family transcriptional regulator [Ralstonia pickettii]PLC40305.1 dipicolinate synthase [Ralstonia pickettii]
MFSKPRILLRLGDVLLRVGLSRSTIYRLISTGEFPSPVRLGPRSVAWRAEEVDEWVNRRPSAKRGS